MSHVAVRILAAAYADATIGINAIAASVPRVAGDAAPPAVTIYNECEHGWVARGVVPDAADATAGISFPAIAITLQGAQFGAGSPQPSDTDTPETGTIKLITQLLLRAAATEDEVKAVSYLMRAARNSIYLMDATWTVAQKTLANTCLDESQSIAQGKTDFPGKDLLCPAAIVSTHQFRETTAVTSQ